MGSAEEQVGVQRNAIAEVIYALDCFFETFKTIIEFIFRFIFCKSFTKIEIGLIELDFER